MKKYFFALVAAVGCFLLPIGDAQVTTIVDMQNKSALSFFLMIAILFISLDWWAFLIAGIELSLNVVNFCVISTWPQTTWLVSHYGQIQSVAFAIEVALIIVAFGHDLSAYLSELADRRGRASNLDRS